MLRQGSITFGDYDLAVQDTVQCLRTAGFTVTNPQIGSDGLLDYTTSISYPGGSPSDKERATEDRLENGCVERSKAVAAVYVLDHAASSQQVKSAFNRFLACSRGLGVAAPNSTQQSQVGTIVQAIQSKMASNAISVSQGDNCLDIFQVVSTPLPGLKQALATYLQGQS